jgi:hypothetical protein
VKLLQRIAMGCILGLLFITGCILLAGCGSRDDGLPRDTACDHVYEGQVFRLDGVVHRVYYKGHRRGEAAVHAQGFEYTVNMPCHMIPDTRRPE